MTQKNALLVYPAFATSFWSFKFALQYLGKKSSMPPLGLLTLANMFPQDYHVRVVDMNVPYGQKIGTCQFIEDYMPATIPPAACLVLLAITLPSNAATK